MLTTLNDIFYIYFKIYLKEAQYHTYGLEFRAFVSNFQNQRHITGQ